MSDQQPRQISPDEVETAVADLKRQLESLSGAAQQRIECTPDNVEQGLARIVLSLVELLRKLLERQAIRRMEGGTLSNQEIEQMGTALMRLEQKVAELAAAFGLNPEDLNLDLGPIGNLLDE